MTQWKWRKARRNYLLAWPWCEKCKKRPADHVDHIIPVADGGEMWDRRNWQSICKPCHHGKTGLENAKRQAKEAIKQRRRIVGRDGFPLT